MKKLFGIRGRWLVLASISYYVIFLYVGWRAWTINLSGSGRLLGYFMNFVFGCTYYGTDPNLPSGVPHFSCEPNILTLFLITVIPIIYAIGWLHQNPIKEK